MTRDDDLSAMRSQRLIAFAWAGLFVAAMIGVALTVRLWPIAPILKPFALIVPMLLLIPMVRSLERAQRSCGTLSLAQQRYNRRVLGWSFAYVLVLIGSLWAYGALHPQGVLAWIIAILPSLPLLVFIWSMGRYLVEEKDEYLRQRMVMASLWATGILLAIATCYGFLESFMLVPRVPSWAAVPVWAIGLAIGNVIIWKRA